VSRPNFRHLIRERREIRTTPITTFLADRLIGRSRFDLTDRRVGGDGWDSETQEIRSWVFDSDGGFGDRFWTEEGKGNRWQIEAVNTLPDGSQSPAVHVITKVDDDHYTWESGNRSVDGLLLPSITVARVGKHNNRRP
jgi:hypothetical protein